MTTAFNLTAGQLITKAYRRLGIVREGGTPNAAQLQTGMDATDAMLKGWQADGINVFRQTQVQLTVTPGAPSVPITPQCMAVENARWATNVGTPSQNERPMGRMAYDDYQNLPNKLVAVASGPSTYTFDKQVSTTDLLIYPCSSVAGQINATVARMANDIGSPGDTLDLPQEWVEGAGYNIADRLMDDYGVAAADQATAERVTERAVAFYKKLLNYDRPTSVKFLPWGRRGRSRLYRR